MKKYTRFISPLLLLLAAMIWGFAFTAQKAAETVPVFIMGATRSIFAVLFLFFASLIFDASRHTGRHLFGKKEKSFLNKYELLGGAVCGVILALASFFQQAGLNAGADAGKSAFITALYVVLVPIYALALKKRAPINVWISVAIAVVGFYFLCISDNFTIAKEDIFVLVCSLIFPIHILTIDFFLPKCDGIKMSLVQFASCALTNVIFALIFERGTNLGIVFEFIFPLFYLGVFSSGIAYTLQIIGQRGANPAAASVILSLESVFGVIGGAILLKEQMEFREYAGCAIVFLAVILSQIDFKSFLKRKA